MHYIQASKILSSDNRINIYRGCSHGCIYCDSRSKCYNLDHEFTDIAVKENALELLEAELVKKRNKVVVDIGSMSDPYMPLENELKLTKKLLELLIKYGHGISLITKSDLVLRDLDLLIKINKQTKASVAMTLTTYDDELCKLIEPNVIPTSKRFETLKKLSEAGINTYVWLTPILPFINDSLDNLRGILNLCKEAKVKGIILFNFGVTLRDGNREYFYSKLDEFFPKIKKEYIKKYNKSYLCDSPYSKYLMDYFIRFCKENNIEFDYAKIETEIKNLETEVSYEQLSLF